MCDFSTLEKIPGYSHALIGTERIESQKIIETYHGSADFTPQDISTMNGLPSRGDDTDLLRHAEPPAGHDPKNSAFRGSVPYPIYPGIIGGAADWAGEGGLVFKIEGWQGYILDEIFSYKIQKASGGYRDLLMKEKEIAIPARVPRDFIKMIGIVEKGRSGLKVTWNISRN